DVADEILETLLEVADDLDHSPSQVAIRWVLEQPAVSAVIVGARTIEQLRDNLGAAEWRLPDDVRGRLSEVSQMPERYPQTGARTVHERRAAAVGTLQRITLTPTNEPSA
ncbi:MAG: aldo/keto reductase, partial [Chloroflexi bacterium]|nr:aldo/keto reductase [Chloroflexota bacterium]